MPQDPVEQATIRGWEPRDWQAVEHERATAPLSAGERLGTTTGPLVLIVEDDPIIGMMLQDMLQQLKCRSIGPAGSVAAALTLLDAVPSLGAALLDCNLGGERVWPVADRLLERSIPFVFCTGYGAAGLEPRFAGAPVLDKPFPLKELARTLLPLLK